MGDLGVRSAAIVGVVDRPRLYEILDSPLVRACVIQGPTGSGKTTLVRSWMLQQDRRGPLLWVSLDDGITTRTAFWHHVVASAVRMGGLDREQAAAIESQLGQELDPVRIAACVLSAAGPVILALDAYEHLGDASARIDADLARLLLEVPQLRVTITTRGHTALADLDLPGPGFVRVITLGELALTADEVGALIESQTGIEDEQLAASVAHATRGFPLTVRAVVLALSQLGRIPGVDAMDWDTIVAARLESLLPDPVAVGFVTDTSVPPYVDLDLAARLSGVEDPAVLLAMLERNGFGRWIPYARGRHVFRYVETIRDTFRARAADDAERFRRSCGATAVWLLENEEVVDQALRFAIESGDYALADRIFVALVIGNPDAYTSDRFLAPLRSVPEAMLHRYPMLAFGLGLAVMSNRMERLDAPRAFRIAVESTAYPAYLEPSIDAFSHAGMRAISRRLALDFPGSAAACAEAARLVDEIDPAVLERHREHVGTVLRQLSFSIWLGGDLDGAIATMNRSVALCDRPAPRTYSTVYVAGASAFAGETHQAAAIMASVDPNAWPPELRGSSMNVLGLLADAYIRLDALDFPGALDALEGTRRYLRTNESWPFLAAAWVSARHGLGQGLAEAERVTRELTGPVRPPSAGDNVATERLRAVLALAWMAGGDHRAAGEVLEGRPDRPHLAAACVAWLLGAGRDGEALELARAALALPGHTARTRAETQTFGAVAALRRADAATAGAWLTAAGLAAETAGARMHVAALDPLDRQALRGLAERHGEEGLLHYLDVRLPSTAPERLSTATLTPRELVVLSALAEHDGTRAMADALFVSPDTVKTQLRSIYRKLGVSSRRAALTVARETGLLDR